MWKNRMTNDQRRMCIQLSKDGLSTNKISELINAPYKLVYLTLYREVRRKPKVPFRKHKVNHEYFSCINTEEKAYWLGFILGDGSIHKGKRSLSIEISERDKQHLEKFLHAVGSNTTIKHTRKKCCKIDVNSTAMMNDLMNLGILPGKTYLDVRTPKIDKSLLCHLYRGLLDADGWITTQKNKNACDQYGFGFTSKNMELLKEIKTYFDEMLDKSVGSFAHKPKTTSYGSCNQFTVYGNRNYIKFYNLCYKNATIFLDRKYEKATQFYKNITSASALLDLKL